VLWIVDVKSPFHSLTHFTPDCNHCRYLQTRVTDGKACPVTVLELLIVAGVEVELRQVASPWVGT
jgi:hypothetical protein